MVRALALGLLMSFAASAAPAQQGARKCYVDYRKNEVCFPFGAASFADEVVSFEKGDPWTTDARANDARKVLGPPDYDDDKVTNYLTLGCAGRLTLRFTKVALVDVPGPDLWVFEIGPAVEPTRLEISEDGKTGIDVGRIAGGTAGVDIGPHVKPGQSFHYVRLTDLKSHCGSEWPGADIDAVGAIGSAQKVVLPDSVLFDFDKATLTPRADAVLKDLADRIRASQAKRVRIEGHTDAKGADAYNVALSQRRANAVRDRLKALGLAAVQFETKGWGKTRPVATNDTDEGRAKNRRVEATLFER